jgi:hypothetical protein
VRRKIDFDCNAIFSPNQFFSWVDQIFVSSSKVGVTREDGHLARLKKGKCGMLDVGRAKKAVNPNSTK